MSVALVTVARVPAVYLVPVVLGVALLALAALVWSGAWRAGHNVVGVPVLITIVPGTAPLLIVFGVTPYIPTAAGAVLVMLALLVALASWVLMTIRPQWYGPRWWREYRLLDVPEPAPEPVVAAHNSEQLARAARRPANRRATSHASASVRTLSRADRARTAVALVPNSAIQPCRTT